MTLAPPPFHPCIPSLTLDIGSYVNYMNWMSFFNFHRAQRRMITGTQENEIFRERLNINGGRHSIHADVPIKSSGRRESDIYGKKSACGINYSPFKSWPNQQASQNCGSTSDVCQSQKNSKF